MKNLFLVLIAFVAINAQADDFKLGVTIDEFDDRTTYTAIKASKNKKGAFFMQCQKGKLSTIIGAFNDYYGVRDQRVFLRVDKNQTIKVLESETAMQTRSFYLTDEIIQQLKNGDRLLVRVSAVNENFDYEFDIKDAKKAFDHIEPPCKI